MRSLLLHDPIDLPGYFQPLAVFADERVGEAVVAADVASAHVPLDAGLAHRDGGIAVDADLHVAVFDRVDLEPAVLERLDELVLPDHFSIRSGQREVVGEHRFERAGIRLLQTIVPMLFEILDLLDRRRLRDGIGRAGRESNHTHENEPESDSAWCHRSTVPCRTVRINGKLALTRPFTYGHSAIPTESASNLTADVDRHPH